VRHFIAQEARRKARETYKRKAETAIKAAVVPALGAKLEAMELPVPEPGPGQVLVWMQSSGLCCTDIHAAVGDWPVKPNPPFTSGHEGAGIVEKADPGAPRTSQATGFPEALAEAGLPGSLAAAATSTEFDQLIKDSRDEAFSEVGLDIGTPVLRVAGKARDAIGPNPSDPHRAQSAAEAGRRQGRVIAAEVKALWA
jgi:propanol-preferring alcohol dehydrogenase